MMFWLPPKIKEARGTRWCQAKLPPAAPRGLPHPKSWAVLDYLQLVSLALPRLLAAWQCHPVLQQWWNKKSPNFSVIFLVIHRVSLPPEQQSGGFLTEQQPILFIIFKAGLKKQQPRSISQLIGFLLSCLIRQRNVPKILPNWSFLFRTLQSSPKANWLAAPKRFWRFSWMRFSWQVSMQEQQ